MPSYTTLLPCAYWQVVFNNTNIIEILYGLFLEINIVMLVRIIES